MVLAGDESALRKHTGKNKEGLNASLILYGKHFPLASNYELLAGSADIARECSQSIILLEILVQPACPGFLLCKFLKSAICPFSKCNRKHKFFLHTMLFTFHTFPTQHVFVKQ